MSAPIARILNSYPASFFRQSLEYADAGFGEAWALASRHAEEPERANMLGQLRHARCEAGFRKAARDNGLAVLAPHTEPAGGRYSLVEAGGIYLIRSNIQRHCAPPPARDRLSAAMGGGQFLAEPAAAGFAAGNPVAID